MSKANLIIDLNALVANWCQMRSYINTSVDCGAVVKADAYGLGVAKAAVALARAGCKTFYVSSLDEALQVKQLLGSLGLAVLPKIFVLTGCAPGEERQFVEQGVVPVIVSLEMFNRWLAVCSLIAPTGLESALKINTGMGRLGLELSEFNALLEMSERLNVAGVNYLFSHLACADQSKHALNSIQLSRFHLAYTQMKAIFPKVRGSLANSAGISLGAEFHFDMVRPGIAVYGGQPRLDEVLPLAPVASLALPVIQIRNLAPGEFLGYGATRSWQERRVIAVARSGYADGLLRHLSNSGVGYVVHGDSNVVVPIVGRVSMDTTMFDITAVANSLVPGDCIELLCGPGALEALADAAGTSNYEVLTSLGGRYHRIYTESQKVVP